MGKSSRTGRRNGTVTVIETRVHRNSARNARLAFVLAAIFIGGIATVAASQWTQPVLSLLIGIAIGVIAGAICWTAVRVWPVVRVIWWWLGELLAALSSPSCGRCWPPTPRSPSGRVSSPPSSRRF